MALVSESVASMTKNNSFEYNKYCREFTALAPVVEREGDDDDDDDGGYDYAPAA